jgi:hypothetical protein
MRAILRTILLWLMLAAMPLQASASTLVGDQSKQPDAVSVSVATAAHHACAMVDHGAGHQCHRDATNHGCNCSPCCSPLVSLETPSVRSLAIGPQRIAFVAPYFFDFVPSFPQRPPII